MYRPILGITMGDPFGNGPEITVRALADKGVYEKCRPLVVGDLSSLTYAARVVGKVSGIELRIHPVATVQEAEFVPGTIDVLDVRFGSLWTNIPREMFLKLGVSYGDRVEVIIEKRGRTVYRTSLIYAHSFAEAYIGEALVYVNSLDFMAVAINQGSFARAYNIGTGTNWRITIRKAPRLIYED